MEDTKRRSLDDSWKAQALRRRNDIDLLQAEIERLNKAAQEYDAKMMDICRSALKFTLAIRNQNNRKAHAFMLELEALAELYSNEVVIRNDHHYNCRCYLSEDTEK